MGRPNPEAPLVDTPPHNPTTPGSAAWALPESGAVEDGPDGSLGGGPRAEPGAVPSPGPRPTADLDDHGWRDPVGPLGPPILPVPLKPMTTSDILDGAWAITKARPKSVLVVTVAFILPPQLLSAWLVRDTPQTLDAIFALGRTGAFTTQATRSQVALFAAAALVALSYYFLGAALGRLVSSWYAGSDLSIRQVLVGTFKKSAVIIATFLLLLVPIVVSTAACYVGAFFIIPLFMLAGPIIGIEDAGPLVAAKRSWSLVSRRLFWCIWYWIACYLIESLVNTAIQLAPDIIGLVSQGAAEFLGPIASVIAHIVTAPFVVGVSILVYLDLRVRTEGLDLDLEVGDVFTRAA
jgi:hypothetical protein